MRANIDLSAPIVKRIALKNNFGETASELPQANPFCKVPHATPHTRSKSVSLKKLKENRSERFLTLTARKTFNRVRLCGLATAANSPNNRMYK